MSDTKIELKEIKAPSLSSSSYGSDLQQCFENIDKNFKILSNHDFIQGAQGKSLYTVKTSLVENRTNPDGSSGIYLTDTGLQVFFAIVKDVLGNGQRYNDIVGRFETNSYTFYEIKNYIDNYEELKSVDDINVLEHFNDLSFLFIKSKDPSTTDSEIPVGALNYLIFKDARFNRKDLYSAVNKSEDNKSTYTNAVDASCIIYVKNCTSTTVEYEILHDIPSLYYDENENILCWKLYGLKTGIPAQGPEGKDGVVDGNIHIVYVDLDEDISYDEVDALKDYITNIDMSSEKDVHYKVPITSCLVEGTKKNISEVKINTFNINDPAFVYVTYDNIDYVFFSQITSIESGLIKVSVSNSSKLNTNMDSEIVEKTMNRKTFKGLHLPIDRRDGGDENCKHMIWSSGNNYKSQEDYTKYLNIAPLVTDDSEENKMSWSEICGDAQLNICYPTINLFKNALDEQQGISISDNTIRALGSNRKINIPCGVSVNDLQIYSTGTNQFITNNNTNSGKLEISNPHGFITIGDINSNSRNNIILQASSLNDTNGSIIIENSDLNVNGKSIFKGTVEFEKKVTTKDLDVNGYLETDEISAQFLDIKSGNNNITASVSTEGGISITIGGKNTTINGNSIVFQSGDSIIQSSTSLDIQTNTANITGDLNVGKNLNVGNTLKINNVYAGVPIGTIVMWMGSTVPEHWVVCDGHTYSNTDILERDKKIYDFLKNVLNLEEVKQEDGSTGITIPDFSSRFPVGVSSNYEAQATGGGTATLTAENLPQHTHTVHNIVFSENHGKIKTGTLVNDYYTYNATNKTISIGGTGNASTDTGMAGTNEGCDYDNDTFPYIDTETESGTGLLANPTPINIMPPYIGVYFIMKYE
jgi:microcystin-dependent protein